MYRLVQAHQNRADSNTVGRIHTQQVVADVGRFYVRHHQQIGCTAEGGFRIQALAHFFVQSYVCLNLAVDFQFGITFADDFQCTLDFQCIGIRARTVVGMRHQGYFRFDTKTLNFVRTQYRALRHLFGSRILIDVGIGNKVVTFIGNQCIHRTSIFLRVIVTNHLFHNREVVMETTHGAAH